jgi:hypothetical protein
MITALILLAVALVAVYIVIKFVQNCQGDEHAD